jgi:glyoxylase-like metal-dependent hydrolase (beta-lactamase superfamily II)
MQRTYVGDVNVFALVDNIQHYPATAVYPSAGTALDRWAGYFDDEGRIALNFGCFLCVDGDTVLLVDTGWGPEYDGRLLDELAETDVPLSSITHVLFTHLHGDHTGWNLDRATGDPLFPNATYLIPRGDWDHYRSQDPRPDSFVRDVEPLDRLGKLQLIDGEHTIARSLTALPTPGHTPGHTSVAVASGGAHGFILGDVVLSRVDAGQPSLANSFDWDNEIARRTRKATIARLIEQNAVVGASHLDAPGLGRFVRAEGGSAWEPV